jgi:hypothetical protein
MRYWTACLLAFAAPTFGLADPVSIEVRGGAAAPREDPCDIRMVTEDLTVDLGPEEAAVKAVMDFHNEGAAQDVLIGFPQVRWANRPAGVDLRNITFVVDGEAVAVEQLPPVEGAAPLVPPHEGAESWYVARVPFAAAQSRRLEITYSHDHGGSAPGANLGFLWFAYLLKTAGHWKGTLDRLNITISYGDVAGAFCQIAPAGYTLDEANRQVTWQLGNFDGEADEVAIHWWPRVPKVRVDDEEAPIYAYLANGFTPVVDVAALAAKRGWVWHRVGDGPAWLLEVDGMSLQLTQGQQTALLDGRKTDLLYAPCPPLGSGGKGLEGGCMVALRDLEPLVTLTVDNNWREQYLSIK